MILNFIFLAAVLYYKLGGYSVSYLLKGMLKILVSAVVMAGALLMGVKYFGYLFSSATIVQCGLLAVFITAGAIIYMATLQALQLPELTMLTEKIKTRVFKKTGSNA